MPRGAILWVGVITLLIAIYHNWGEVQRTSICDTTYIYEGYAAVGLPSYITAAFPRYKLVRYNDNAPHLQKDIAFLRHHQPNRIPLLFVHGHLGSPKQMRSMASETSREVIRRYRKASSTAGTATSTSQNKENRSNLWIDWYAVNFNEEPSAFEPHLLTEQARFVAACLKYLSAEDGVTTTSSTSDFPLLLVGYSMGGLVVEAALEEILHAANAGSDTTTSKNIIQRLALVLTLGSPRHHLPSFLISPTRTAFSRNSRKSNISSSIDFLPPSVHILAGPGDLMIPGLSSWASIWKPNSKATIGTSASDAPIAGKKSNSTIPLIVLPVQVDMDDVPGVWCTASHKGMVSCNQLVRQTVPLLIDAAARRIKAAEEEEEEKQCSSGSGSSSSGVAAASAAVFTSKAAASKLTTSLLKGMPETIFQTEMLLNEINDGVKVDEKLKVASSSTVAQCRSFKESEFILTQQLQRGGRQQNLCYIWNAGEEYYKNTIKNGSLFFLMSGLAPEAEFKVLAEFSKDSKEVDVSGLARPLPGMLYEYPSATEATSKRPWHVVLDGVDWMQNSTRILRLPFGTGPESFSKIKLEINLPLPHQLKGQSSKTAPIGPPPTFIAQIVPDRSKIEHKVSLFPLKLAAGAHPLALQLDTATATATTAFSVPSPTARLLLNKLLQVAIGQALPFRIHATRTQCPITTISTERTTEPSEEALEHSVPLLAAVGDDNAQHSILIGDTVRKAYQGLSLWHPSVINRDIWFISDPRCSYTVRLVWDLGPWLSYTLRYHAYAIIPLTFALSLFNLQINVKTNFLNFVLPLVALLPALSSVWPEQAARVLGRPPWLPISSVDVCVLGCVAYTVLTSLKYSIAMVNIFFAGLLRSLLSTAATTTSSSTLKRSLTGLQVMIIRMIYIAVIFTTGVHPAMPALLGVVMLQISCLYTKAAATEMSSSPQIFSLKQSWLVTHILASFPAGFWLFGWIASGRSHGYPLFSLERVFMLLQGAHSCTAAFTTATLTSSLSRFIYGQFTVFVAFSGLWGILHVVMPVMAILCSWELVSGLVQRKIEVPRIRR